MMQLSTKSRYATRILVYLALQKRGKAARRHDIARAEGISPDYVEQILLRLKAVGFTQSHRGAKGGYSLAIAPERITVAEVLEAMEGKIALAPCSLEDCTRATFCATRVVWARATEALVGVLGKTNIAEIAEQARHIEDSQAPNFVI